MASADPLVFDMSQMSEATPSVFTKRDFLSLQDQQNGNYAGNQIVIDTSQLANSNKYMAYREAFLSVPMVLAATSYSPTGTACPMPNPAKVGTSVDMAFGLKNWFGTIIHSMILDYSGTTIIQQTPLCGLWSIFTLMTTMSLGDLETQSSSIGFYPDDVNFIFNSSGLISAQGSNVGVCNNVTTAVQGNIISKNASGQQFSNNGFFQRRTTQ